MSDPVQSMVDGMNMVADAMDDARKAIIKEREEAAMGIPAVSPEQANFDAGMEPPDEPERLVAPRDAPLSALLGAAIDQCGDGVGSESARETLRWSLFEWLESIPVAEIELTREEYAEYSEARRPCDGDQ